MDISLSPRDAAGGATDDRPLPIYLPTSENHDAYKTVMVERKVTVPPPPEPVKDAKTIELEVRSHYTVCKSAYVVDDHCYVCDKTRSYIDLITVKH